MVCQRGEHVTPCAAQLTSESHKMQATWIPYVGACEAQPHTTYTRGVLGQPSLGHWTAGRVYAWVSAWQAGTYRRQAPQLHLLFAAMIRKPSHERVPGSSPPPPPSPSHTLSAAMITPLRVPCSSPLTHLHVAVVEVLGGAVVQLEGAGGVALGQGQAAQVDGGVGDLKGHEHRTYMD